MALKQLLSNMLINVQFELVTTKIYHQKELLYDYYH
jgi:hypothetical protein